MDLFANNYTDTDLFEITDTERIYGQKQVEHSSIAFLQLLNETDYDDAIYWQIHSENSNAENRKHFRSQDKQYLDVNNKNYDESDDDILEHIDSADSTDEKTENFGSHDKQYLDVDNDHYDGYINDILCNIDNEDSNEKEIIEENSEQCYSHDEQCSDFSMQIPNEHGKRLRQTNIDEIFRAAKKSKFNPNDGGESSFSSKYHQIKKRILKSSEQLAKEKKIRDMIQQLRLDSLSCPTTKFEHYHTKHWDIRCQYDTYCDWNTAHKKRSMNGLNQHYASVHHARYLKQKESLHQCY